MQVTYKNLTIESEFKGLRCSNWSDDNQNNHHHITIKNNDKGLKIKFNFWTSLAEPKIETEEQLFNALYCFISDCLVGAESYEDFIDEFGYENNDESEIIYSMCEKSYYDFNRISDESLYEFANELSDYIEDNF